MRVIFALVGFVFDLAVMAVSATVVYCAVQPDMYFELARWAGQYMESPSMRMQTGGAGLVFFILSFRLMFLVVFRKPVKTFLVRKDDGGSVTVSRSTIDNIVTQLASKMEPPSAVDSLQIRQRRDSRLAVSVRLKLNLTNDGLKDYTTRFDKSVKKYFAECIGLEIAQLDLQATGVAGATPPPHDQTTEEQG